MSIQGGGGGYPGGGLAVQVHILWFATLLDGGISCDGQPSYNYNLTK